VRELLRTLPPADAARVLGNRERMAQVMNGGDWRKLPGLRLEAVGENARMRKHKDAIPFADQAIIPIEKLISYALNPDHPKGADKARVLMAAFGFGPSHAESLAEQLMNALPFHAAVERPRTEYGRAFSVDLPVSGPKGAGMVSTGWLLPDSEFRPKLVTLRAVKGSKK